MYITRIKIAVLSLMILAGGYGCSSKEPGNKQEQPEQPAPDKPVEADIKGSFAGKFVRYNRGDSAPQTIVTQWCDTVWRNDRVHQQLVLWTDKAAVSSISYKINPLHNGSNTIAADNLRLRFVKYITGDKQALTCGGHTSRTNAYVGDALSEEYITKVASDDPLKIWITADIPSDTPAGVYEGTIEVLVSGEKALEFGVKFLVADHTLPDPREWTFHLDIWQFPFHLHSLCARNGIKFDMFQSAYFMLMEPFYELLADAGQSAVTTYIKDGAFNTGQTMIDWTMLEDGTWAFDYTNFDAFVRFMEDVGIDKQINCLSPAGWNESIGYTDASDGTYKYMELPIESELYATVWDSFLTDFRKHLTEKGWMNKAVLYMDEIPQEKMKRVVEVIRNNGADWKLGLAGSEIDASIEREMYDYSTIIGYNRKSTNNTVATFYTSCSQSHPNNYVTSETSPAEMVWMAWHCMAKGFNGYLRWAFDYWTQTDPLNVQDGSNSAGDFNMIYRTANNMQSQPISSIRFELLREGIQDFEKVRILGSGNIRSVLSNFADPTAKNAETAVRQAQSQLKKSSL